MMNKKAVTSVMLILATMNINAQKEEKTMKVFSDIKFSGYIIGQYQANFQGSNSNTFNIRMARASVSGRILGEFEYKVQGQVNGNSSTLGSSPRIVDLFVEWQRFEFARIKIGQFKRV